MAIFTSAAATVSGRKVIEQMLEVLIMIKCWLYSRLNFGQAAVVSEKFPKLSGVVLYFTSAVIGAPPTVEAAG